MILANSSYKHVSKDVSTLERQFPSRAFLILLRAQGLYEDLRDELDRADQDDNEYCLLLSNGADGLDSFISGLERLREAGDG